ncbi:hypothetical protein [Pseudomonas sp.]|uniref:hypothetical protein n=2 Tax=Pseudomonas sp. TaxID=306 RepID=UPI004054284B
MSEYSNTTGELFSLSRTAIDRASLSAARISDGASPSLKEKQFSYSPGLKPKLEAPPKFSDMFQGADKSDQNIAELNDQVDGWIGKYFPAINGDFKTINEDWCANVISGVKPFGVPNTVFELVWHQARDRAYRTVESESRSIEAQFSSRGFSLPPGAMAKVLGQLEQRATDSILEVSREQAIKDADIKVLLLQHATQIAAQLKTAILNTSADFFRAWYGLYQLDAETARIRANAYTAYYNTLQSYYDVEVTWERLRLDAARVGADVNSNIDRNRIAMFQGGGAAGAHAQAARGFAEISASAGSAAGTLVAQVEQL